MRDAAVLEGSEIVAKELTPQEILAQMGQLAKALEVTSPSVAKALKKQTERLERKAIQDVLVPFDDGVVLEALDKAVIEYQESGADSTMILMIRGGEVRKMRMNPDNHFVTPTGIKKILQPSREGSAGKNPQALSLEFFADGTFAIEPSHAGADYQGHMQNKWK